jgi:hypothetical protein
MGGGILLQKLLGGEEHPKGNMTTWFQSRLPRRRWHSDEKLCVIWFPSRGRRREKYKRWCYKNEIEGLDDGASYSGRKFYIGSYH